MLCCTENTHGPKRGDKTTPEWHKITSEVNTSQKGGWEWFYTHDQACVQHMQPTTHVSKHIV